MSAPETAMLEQIHSLPQLIGECGPSFAEQARQSLGQKLALSLEGLYVTGCGDSHHAAVASELAFHELGGVPCQALSALPFSRYTVPFLPCPGRVAVVGISVSGEVSRTVEALRLAQQAGATTIALTSNPDSRLAHAADHVLQVSVTPSSPVPTPGVRSYVATLLMLYLVAMQIGELRGGLGADAAEEARHELLGVAGDLQATLESNELITAQLAARWADADGYVFLGGGPNYGTALFCAAKLLEASGEPALGQDVEEWTHLQYFARVVTTPTIVIDAGGRGSGRAREAAVAARAIGRRVAAVVPRGEREIAGQADAVLEMHGTAREAFSPLLYCLPGMLLAHYRSQALGETYFRGFGGGRSVEGGGGISRIRSSWIQEELGRGFL
jgi:glucosamine--fructose-6-phosphate aminotransferase (isomerizing)